MSGAEADAGAVWRDAAAEALEVVASRDESALRLLCAFNGVDWKSAPPEWWRAPNSSSHDAWRRVMDEARIIIGEEAIRGPVVGSCTTTAARATRGRDVAGALSITGRG